MCAGFVVGTAAALVFEHYGDAGIGFYSMFYNSSRQRKRQVVKQQRKKYSFAALICLSASSKSGKNIYRIISECKNTMIGFILSYTDGMEEIINTLLMNSTNWVRVVIVHYLLFHPLFSHNFPPVVGIHWGKHEFIFALAIKMWKYLYIVCEGSFSLFSCSNVCVRKLSLISSPACIRCYFHIENWFSM